jgi:hypothetical protein
MMHDKEMPSSMNAFCHFDKASYTKEVYTKKTLTYHAINADIIAFNTRQYTQEW